MHYLSHKLKIIANAFCYVKFDASTYRAVT